MSNELVEVNLVCKLKINVQICNATERTLTLGSERNCFKHKNFSLVLYLASATLSNLVYYCESQRPYL